MSYIPLAVHTHYSLLKSATKPDKLAERLVQLGMTRCGVTDYHSVSGLVQVSEKFKEHNISPILGSKLRIGETNNIVLAKNLNGWKNILKLLSLKECDINNLLEYSQDIILMIGSHDSLSLDTAPLLKEAFKDDLYLQVQLASKKDVSYAGQVRTFKDDIKKVAVPCPLYLSKTDRDDNLILHCTKENLTLEKLATKLEYNDYTSSSNFFLPHPDEMIGLGYSHEELKTTFEIAEKCESLKITGKPSLPKVADENPDEALRELCRQGWKNKIQDIVEKSKHNKYLERIKSELDVLQGANLSPYFLIVADVLKYVSDHGWLKGAGRGSAAGCLVSYLADITDIDPIEYDLVFERFYNAGRNTKDKVQLPDIDIDIPTHKREDIIHYLYNKYGHDNCGQIVTFQTMKGRSVMRSVLSANDAMSLGEIYALTENIPDQAKIADELQQMKDDGEEPSIVLWALEHRANKFREYVQIEDGRLVGPMARYFEQAIRLEGTKTHASRHASGIIIAPSKLEDYGQIMHLKDCNVCGWEMTDAEAVGLLKLDVLGLNTLDKLTGVSSILETGDINADFAYR